MDVSWTYEVDGDFFNDDNAGVPATKSVQIGDSAPEPVPVSGFTYTAAANADSDDVLSWTAVTQGMATSERPVVGYHVQFRLDDGAWHDGGHTGTSPTYSAKLWRWHWAKLEFRVQTKTSFNEAEAWAASWSEAYEAATRIASTLPKLTVTAPLPVVQLMTDNLPPHLEWTAPTGTVLGYQIHRRAVSATDSQFTLIETEHSETSYRDDDVVAGETYEYRVQANNFGNGGNPLSDAVRIQFVNPPEMVAGETELQLTNYLGTGASFTSDGPRVLESGRVHEFNITRDSGMWGYGGNSRGFAFDAGLHSWARWIDPDDIGACRDVLFCVMRQAGDDYEYRPENSAPSRWLAFWRGTDVTTAFANTGTETFRVYVPSGISVTRSIEFGLAETSNSFPRVPPEWLTGGEPPAALRRSLEVRSQVVVPSSLTVTSVSNNRVRIAWEAANGNYFGFRVQRRNASDASSTYEPVCCDLASNVRQVLDTLPTNVPPGTPETYQYRVGTYLDDGYVRWFGTTVTFDPATDTAADNAPVTFAAADQDLQVAVAAGGMVDREMPAATGGAGPLTYSVSIPTGAEVVFNPTTRRLSGAPPAGTFHGTLHASDANGATDDLRFSIVVGALAAMPSNLMATRHPSLRQIELSWGAPTQTGSGAIKGYRIDQSPSGMAGTWLPVVLSTGSTATMWTHANLRGRHTVHYRVAAINDAGVGAFSGQAQATTVAATAPSAPVGFTAITEAGGYVALAWEPPTSDGGANILGYCVQVAFRSDPTVDGATGRSNDRVVLAPRLPASARSYRYSGHQRGGYPVWYRVGAFNASSEGVIIADSAENIRTCNERTSGTPTPPTLTTVFASARTATVDATVPGTPTNLRASNTEEPYYIVLRWDAPADNGGNPITGYRITRTAGGAKSANDLDTTFNTLVADTQSTRTVYVDRDLQSVGAWHSYKVAAITTAGVGTFTGRVNLNGTNEGAPGRMVDVEAQPGRGQIELVWGPPHPGIVSGSLDTITGYYLQISDSDDGGWGSTIEVPGGATAASYTDSDLDAGQQRYYRIAADNADGATGGRGPWSQTISGRTIVNEAPPCTGGLSQSLNNNVLTINAHYSSDANCQPAPTAGMAIVEYSYDRWTEDDWRPLARIGPLGSAAMSETVDLTVLRRPGHKMWGRAWYQASSDARGPYVTWELVDDTGTTDSKPLAPPNLVAAPYPDAVFLSWEGAFPGADPIEHYHVQHQATGGEWSESTELDSYANQHAVTGLTSATAYNFRVRASNTARGDGAWSEVSATTLAADNLPNPPRNLAATVTPGTRTVELTWDTPLPGSGGVLPEISRSEIRVQQATGSLDNTFITFGTVAEDTTSYTRTSAQRGTTEFYRLTYVVVGFESGNIYVELHSLPSNIVSTTVPGVPPGVPRDLAAFGGRDSVLLEWRGPGLLPGGVYSGSDVESFRIQHRATDSDMWVDLVPSTGDNLRLQFYDRTAPDGVARQYQIAAINDSGLGDYATSVSATANSGRPGEPRDVVGIVQGEDVEVRWRPPLATGSGAGAIVNYRIDRSPFGFGGWSTLTSNLPGDRTNYLDTTTVTTRNQNNYVYRVIAINSNTPGESLPSRTQQLTVRANWVRSPTSLRVESGVHRHRITWNRVPGGGGVTISGYRLEYASSPDAAPTAWRLLEEVESSSITSHTHDELEDETADHLYYRVASTTSSGRSVYSITVGEPVRDAVDFLDLNASTTVDVDDLRILYFALGFRELLGNNTGNQPGFLDFRRAMLGSIISGMPTDDQLKELISDAHGLTSDLLVPDFDLNLSGTVTEDDVLVLYLVEVLADEFGSEQTGVDFRRNFLGPLAREQNPSDGDLQQLLQRANELLGN